MRLVRLVSVTAMATATCALWALPASAATAASHARHPSTTSVSVSPSPAWVGQSVRLSAKVRSSGQTPTGTVMFLSFGRRLCIAHLSHGAGSCNASFGAVNTYIVRGFYSGDRTHRGSVGAATVIVRRSPTTTAITGKPGVIDLGSTYTFNVTVTVPAGTPAATGTVKLAPVVPTTLSGYYCTATLTAGKGSCTVQPSEYGIDHYTATYTGNAAHRRSVSDGKFTLTVKNKTTTTVPATMATAGSVTLTALVHAGPALGANITFANGGRGSLVFYLSMTQNGAGNPVTGCTGAAGAAVVLTTFTGAPDYNNVATCTGSSMLNGLAKGTYYISAVFSGDDVNEPSSTTTVGTLTVN